MKCPECDKFLSDGYADTTIDNEISDKLKDHIKLIESDDRSFLREQNKIMREALEKIAGADFRGNRPNECVITYNALENAIP